MRGLEKKSHGKGTNRHAINHTDGHRDSMIESAQWADSMKIYIYLYLKLLKLIFYNTFMKYCELIFQYFFHNAKYIVLQNITDDSSNMITNKGPTFLQPPSPLPCARKFLDKCVIYTLISVPIRHN